MKVLAFSHPSAELGQKLGRFGGEALGVLGALVVANCQKTLMSLRKGADSRVTGENSPKIGSIQKQLSR